MARKRVLPYTQAWEKEANALARDFAPQIYPCVHCGHPTIQGYCCTACGSQDPSGTAEEYKEFYKWVNAHNNK